MPLWNPYGPFFHDHSARMASGTIYIAIVLSAIQVGLATSSLKDNTSFQSISYGFTVFSIMGPIIAVLFIFLQFSGSLCGIEGRLICGKAFATRS